MAEEMFEKIQEEIREKKFQESILKLQVIEKQYESDYEYKNSLFFQLAACYSGLRQWQKAIEYLNKFDNESAYTQEMQYEARTMKIIALLNNKDYENLKTTLNLYIHEEDLEYLQPYFYCFLGCMHNEQKKYHQAVKDFETANKLDDGGQWVWIRQNYAYTKLQLGKYKEALRDIESVIEKQGKSIFDLMIQSEANLKLGNIDQSLKILAEIKVIVESNSYDKDHLFDSELEQIKNKYSSENMKLIDDIIKVQSNSSSITEESAKLNYETSLKQIVLKFTSKEEMSIDDAFKKKIQDQINTNFSVGTLQTEQAKKQLESLTTSKELQEYNDSFLSQASLIFLKSQMLLNGASLLQTNVITDFGIEITKLIPIFGSTINGILNALKSASQAIQKEKLKLNAKSIFEFGITTGQFESLMQEISAQVLSDKSYQEQIKNKSEELVIGYKKKIQQLQELYELKKRQVLKVDLLEKTPQRILGAKDAEELIGGYIVTGYLQQYQKNELITIASSFICGNDDYRNQKREIAQLSAKNKAAEIARSSACCSIF